MAFRKNYQQKKISEGITLCKDNTTGIAWIINGRTGMSHSCHPNIDISGSIRGMKNLGYWGKNDRIVRSHGYQYNIDLFVIDKNDELDVLVANECMCDSCIERRKSESKAEYMWLDTKLLEEDYPYSGPCDTLDTVISEAVNYFKHIYSNGTQRACSEKPEISVRKLVNGEVLSEEKMNLSKQLADMKEMYELYKYIKYIEEKDDFNVFQELRKAEYDNEYKSGSVTFELSGPSDEECVVVFDTLEEVFDYIIDETSLSILSIDEKNVCSTERFKTWTAEELLKIEELAGKYGIELKNLQKILLNQK